MGRDSKQKEQDVQTMLEKFASAFTSGDGKKAADCWEAPALIVSDEGTKAVSSLAEVEAFFGGAADQYNAQGITGTRPEIQNLTWLTDRIVSVEVRWPYLNKDGVEQAASESSTYLLRFDDGGTPKITVAVMMGTKAAE